MNSDVFFEITHNAYRSVNINFKKAIVESDESMHHWGKKKIMEFPVHSSGDIREEMIV